jgi:DNA topoisomerase IA
MKCALAASEQTAAFEATLPYIHRVTFSNQKILIIIIVIMRILFLVNVLAVVSYFVPRISKRFHGFFSSISLVTPKEVVLVIVESPAKAKTIENFLGNGDGNIEYIVDYCAGHVRDFPKGDAIPSTMRKQILVKPLGINIGNLGVDIYNDFKPVYVPMDNKIDVINRLLMHSTRATRILFATDEDREGEAISWHLIDLLKPAVPYQRAVFHEITESAIKAAFESPRQLDINLVHAQETRKVLDRLAGYTLSPVLWK